MELGCFDKLILIDREHCFELATDDTSSLNRFLSNNKKEQTKAHVYVNEWITFKILSDVMY